MNVRVQNVVAPARTLRAPLFTDWSEQYARLTIEGLRAGAPVGLQVDGKTTPFQYTGVESAQGAEIMVKLGFAANQDRQLEFVPAGRCSTNLERVEIAGPDISPFVAARFSGLFDSFAAFPFQSCIRCGVPLKTRRIVRTNEGPLFTDYEIKHEFEEGRRYGIRLRCYRQEPFVEVSETFLLGMDAELELVLNPQGVFDSILSLDSFEGENQPTVEPLDQERPRDVLCRLQMPVLTEYFVPNNRGWFAFFNSKDEQRGMLGIMGLYGAKWVHPVENMMHVAVAGGRAVLTASLESGARHWLLYAGSVDKEFTPTRRQVFHRLHAEFNALRLDEHLDLTGREIYDASCWNKPGYLSENFRQQMQRATKELPPLRRFQEAHSLADAKAAGTKFDLSNPLYALLYGDDTLRQELLDRVLRRFEKWVVQFQGYREGKHDYAKNVIGFSRVLRRLLITYELLRKEKFLTDEQVRKLNSYFVFAARRILDEGRWPHSKTWMHPDHPESTRDFYTYPGEHKPDKLIWTNCLPNFQSDPMAALLQLSATIPDHPDAPHWRRFAQDDIERQLDAYCSASGAWEESINYALFTFYYFTITFRVVKNRFGIDYFNDERMRRFAGWLTRFFGPFDKRVNAYTFPGIGNSSLPQQDGCALLAYASELKEDDPLRHDLIAVSQKILPMSELSEDNALLAVAMPLFADREYPLRPLKSEHMQDLGVAMRHEHPSAKESYLFQKIGFWKDHYENDETSFNWYAKGTPLVMDYGTYSPDIAPAAAHNLVEVPDMDSLRRGYLADGYFTPLVDYSRCEVPVTLKLQHGYIRTWAEIDGPPKPPKFFYLCDENPVGPKTWKVRQLLFVKPDYVLLFDRVFGAVPHRYNLHVTADALTREGAAIRAKGRFELDLFCFVQHPRSFEFQEGEIIPGGRAEQRQRFFRIYNTTDATYRTVLFAQERGRNVTVESFGAHGVKVVTPEYTDYAFANDQVVNESRDGVHFSGRVGWIRRETSGRVIACVPDGDVIEAFGKRIEGRGPWKYNMDGKQTVESQGVPRSITVGASS